MKLISLVRSEPERTNATKVIDLLELNHKAFFEPKGLEVVQRAGEPRSEDFTGFYPYDRTDAIPNSRRGAAVVLDLDASDYDINAYVLDVSKALEKTPDMIPADAKKVYVEVQIEIKEDQYKENKLRRFFCIIYNFSK